MTILIMGLLLGMSRRLDSFPSVSLAVGAPAHLEVAVCQRHATVQAAEASHVMLDLRLVLGKLSLDAAIAAAADAVVELVVMVLAVRSVLEHVKDGRRKRLVAGAANKARLVILAAEPPIR